MSVVPPDRRGMGAGARMMLVQTGFIISIALSIGLVASVVDPKTMLAIFSGTQIGARGVNLDPFMTALHIAFGVGAVASFIGAVVSALRGPHPADEPETEPTRGRAVAA